MSDYLARKSTEIENMLMTEYDYDTDIAVQREEAYEDGLSKGISQGAYQEKLETAKNFLSMGLSIEQIARGTGLSLETLQQLEKDFHKR